MILPPADTKLAIKPSADIASDAPCAGNGEDHRRMLAAVNELLLEARREPHEANGELAHLARELHDGLLQSLAAAAMQLDIVARLIPTDPTKARERLQVIARMLCEQQRDLRMCVQDLRPIGAHVAVPVTELAAALERLREQVEFQHGIRVWLRVPVTGVLPRALADHVYRILQEGLANITKHARASVARLHVRIDATRVRIVIADDGVGFPFHGSFHLADLLRSGLGPRSLKERVASLRGALTLTSNRSGSRLEISLPTTCM